MFPFIHFANSSSQQMRSTRLPAGSLYMLPRPLSQEQIEEWRVWFNMIEDVDVISLKASLYPSNIPSVSSFHWSIDASSKYKSNIQKFIPTSLDEATCAFMIIPTNTWSRKGLFPCEVTLPLSVFALAMFGWSGWFHKNLGLSEVSRLENTPRQTQWLNGFVWKLAPKSHG